MPATIWNRDKPSALPGWAFVRWPKNASDATATWWCGQLPECKPMGHASAQEVQAAYPHARLVTTMRRPTRWLESWYAHCLRGGRGNLRVQSSLRLLMGSRDTEPLDVQHWPQVMQATLHPAPSAQLIPVDHLLNPGGLLGQGYSLWDAGLRHWCMTERRWVDAIVPTSQLNAGMTELLGVPVDIHAMNEGGDVVQHVRAMTPAHLADAADALMQVLPSGLQDVMQGHAGPVWRRG